jgi:hypothetical protein
MSNPDIIEIMNRVIETLVFTRYDVAGDMKMLRKNWAEIERLGDALKIAILALGKIGDKAYDSDGETIEELATEAMEEVASALEIANV